MPNSQLRQSADGTKAREFNVTKATVSDAMRVLLAKGYLTKDHSPTDARRYNLLLTPAGRRLVEQVADYTAPLHPPPWPRPKKRRGRHRCRLLEIDLVGEEVRLDCPEFAARGDLP